jgi:hypothetical protein
VAVVFIGRVVGRTILFVVVVWQQSRE